MTVVVGVVRHVVNGVGRWGAARGGCHQGPHGRREKIFLGSKYLSSQQIGNFEKLLKENVLYQLETPNVMTMNCVLTVCDWS